MLEIPLIGPAYKHRALALSAQVAKNLWPEINPEARSTTAMHNTPGCKSFAAMSGADRGMHDFNGTMFTVKGNTLYSVDADGLDTSHGTIAGSNRCVFANDSIQMIITTGGTAYKYTVAGGLEAITDPDLVNPISVAYMNSQFMLDQNNGVSGQFVTSSIDPTFSVDALDFATAEGHPDDILRIFAFNQNMYLFGSDSVEPWYNSGTGNPPWARVQGGVRPYGIAGTHAIAATSEYMYFLDHKRRPMRSGGLDFQNIGTPAVGVEFSSYSRIDDCIVMQYIQDNQQFVVFTFPTANRTWGFHEPSGAWFQLAYGVGDDRHRASSMLYIYGLNFAADHSNGNIYEFDPCTYTDNGDVIQRRRQTAVIHGGLFGKPGAKMFFDEVEFIIAAGDCDVRGTGQGPNPIGSAVTGVCGTTDNLVQGGTLLSPHGLMQVDSSNLYPGTTTPSTDGYEIEDSKAFSMTAAFCRENPPTDNAHIVQFSDSRDYVNTFACYMGTDGFIHVVAKNSARTTILDVTISNKGASFADSDAHTIGIVVNLDDATAREVYLDGLNIGENPSYTTWTTYTDDTIKFNWLTSVNDMRYYFGGGYLPGYVGQEAYGSSNSSGPAAGIDSIGYVCFDNDCSLVGVGMFDNDGWLRDPQGDFTGWFLRQPKIAFGPSFFKQAGLFTGIQVSANNGSSYISAHTGQQEGTKINNEIAGSVSVDVGGSLPPPPTTTRVSIGSPHWSNLSSSMTGNYVNPVSYTTTGFSNVFGAAIESRESFEGTFDVNKAISVSTTDPDQRLSLVSTTAYTSAAIVLVDSDGDLVDWCYRDGSPSVTGSNVTIPADGATYYLIITSNNGKATVRMWDSSTTVSTAGSKSWLSFFGTEFGVGTVYDKTATIPAEGISLAFTVPSTSSAIRVSFSSVEIAGIPTTRTGSVSQVVGAYTASPSYTWGIGGGIKGGINLSGQDIDLIPGQTYFFNVRNNTPVAGGNFIRLQVTYRVQ